LEKTEVIKIKLDFLDTNSYVIYGDGVNFLIDPGSESEKIIKYLEKRKKDLDFIINTHCHFDHIGAADTIAEYFKIPVYIHQNEEDILKNPSKNLSSFFNVNTLLLKTYKLIYGKEVKDFLSKKIDIINTPGHTPGSIIIKYDNYLFTGDLIFKDSIGRTDLPGGNPAEMRQSLNYVKNLEKNLIIFPGHGIDTTIEDELKSNYFLNH
jgi:glyoxylase-like metal-dependent hydrolase (beta-lactamase superfamily II)